MANRVNIRGAFAGATVGTTAGTLGGTSNSNPIDLRDINRMGNFTLSYTVGLSGTHATAGSVDFTYLCAQYENGSYIKPSGAGTIGTSAVAAGESGIWSFSPLVTPWMKIQAIVGTSCPATITAELNVQ